LYFSIREFVQYIIVCELKGGRGTLVRGRGGGRGRGDRVGYKTKLVFGIMQELMSTPYTFTSRLASSTSSISTILHTASNTKLEEWGLGCELLVRVYNSSR